MRVIHSIFYGIAFVLIAGIIGYGFVTYYPFIFSKRVRGLVISVERVQLNVSLMQNQGEKVDPQFFSFSVAIRQDDGEILTASAEDRQWASVQRGLCAEATFYPYPFWKVMKSGTYFNARLDRLWECPEKATLAPPIPPGAAPELPVPPAGTTGKLPPTPPPLPPKPTLPATTIPTH